MAIDLAHRALWRRSIGRAVRLGALSVFVAGATFVAVTVLWVAAYGVVNPPTTLLIAYERARIGEVAWTWRPIEDISPELRRAALAAEDAGFCDHWGVEIDALQLAWDAYRAGRRAPGGSTITQQTAKNLFLWHDRSLVRKALEIWFSLLMELLWSKERILEIYLNVAEFDEGVFGVEAASQRAFDESASDLALWRAVRIIAVLPAPRVRSIVDPSEALIIRADAIADGARTIEADGRAACVAPAGAV